MIRCVTKSGGRLVLIFGLTDETLAFFKRGDAVLCNGEELGGCPVDAVLLYGETSGDILRQLRKSGIVMPDDAEAQVEAAGPGKDAVFFDGRLDITKDGG